MQYRTGTVAVTNGSNSVVGTGTAFLANVPVGSLFSVSGSGVPYIVAAVPDDTHLTLASNYGGATAAGQSYACTTSFTTNHELPYPEAQDIDTHTILKRAMVQIDTMLGAAIGSAAEANRLVYTDASGNLKTGAGLTYNESTGGAALPGNVTLGDAGADVHTANGVLNLYGDNAGGDGTYLKMGNWAALGLTTSTLKLGGIAAGQFDSVATYASNAEITRVTSAGLAVTGIVSSTGAQNSDLASTISNTTNGTGAVASLHFSAGGTQYGGVRAFSAAYSSAGYADRFVINAQNNKALLLHSAGTGHVAIAVGDLAAECARFTNGRYFKVSDIGAYNNATGTFHEILSSAAVGVDAPTLRIANTHATNPGGVGIVYTADPNNTANEFIYLVANGNVRGNWRSNGGIANYQANDVNLSDARAKVDLRAAPSYWDFIERVAATLKTGVYAGDGAAKRHTMLVAQDIEPIDAGVIVPWRRSELVQWKGVTEHEIQMRALGVIGELQRRVKALEARVLN